MGMDVALNVFDFALISYDMTRLEELDEHYSSLGELPYQ
jgi:hypothetical protein